MSAYCSGADNYGIYNDYGEIVNDNVDINVSLSTGTYISNTLMYGIYNETGKIKFNEGNIKTQNNVSSTYNADRKYYCIYNNLGTLELGIKDSNVLTLPTLISEDIGIQNTGIFNFYDGIIKGKQISILGDCTELENVYGMQIEIEGEYEKAYLGVNTPVASVNGIKYNTIKEAITACGDTSYSIQIDILKGFKIDKNDYINIGQNQNIIINLSGFTVIEDKEIINNGILKIIDESENQTGNVRLYIREDKDKSIINNKILKINIPYIYINSESELKNIKGIYNDNNGNVEISYTKCKMNGKICNYGNSLIYNNSGYVKISDSNLVMTESWSNGSGNSVISKIIYNKDRLDIYGGKIEFVKNDYYHYYNSIYNDEGGIMNLIGGEIKNASSIHLTNNYVIYNKGIIEKIEDFILTTGYQGNNIYNSGTNAKITINSGTIKNAYSGYSCVYNTAGEVIINGGEYIYGNIYNIAGGKLTITGGTITNTSGYGVYNCQNSSSTTQVSTVTIGVQDTIVNTTYPKIEGSTYGIYNSKNSSSYPEPIFKFYDGSITGATASIYGEVTEIEPNYEIRKTWKNNKETAILSVTDTLNAAARIGSVNYDTIEDALETCSAEKETTIVLLNMITAESGTITVPDGYSIKFDLNGFGMRNTKLINNGTLTIVDESVDKSGVIVCETGTAIENNGTLTIGTDDGSIVLSPIIKAETAIENNSTFNFYDGKLMGTINTITGGGTRQIPAGATENSTTEDSYNVLTLN